jgi:hypothetical protein
MQAELEALDREERHLLDDAAAHSEEDADDDIYQTYMCGRPACCPACLTSKALRTHCTAAAAFTDAGAVQIPLTACYVITCNQEGGGCCCCMHAPIHAN